MSSLTLSGLMFLMKVRLKHRERAISHSQDGGAEYFLCRCLRPSHPLYPPSIALLNKSMRHEVYISLSVGGHVFDCKVFSSVVVV